MRNREDYLIEVADPAALLTAPAALAAIAGRACAQVFRTDFSRPGFALLDLGRELSPRRLRQTMIALLDGMSQCYQRTFDRSLIILSMGRFDQKVTTEAHLDGGPEDSLLLLGYEPTAIDSRLFLLDYAQYACERNMPPREFLAQFNPMVRKQRDALDNYTTEVQGFQANHYRIVVINNGSVACEEHRRGMLGVLHKAVMIAPRGDQERYVNSIMLAAADPGTPVRFTGDEVRAFIESAA